MIIGESDSDETIGDVRKFQITDEWFELFCEKHNNVTGYVAENSKTMANSYLLLDEFMSSWTVI